MYITQWLKDNHIPETNGMAAHIGRWNGWYNASNPFYNYTARDTAKKRTYTRKRKSLRLPRLICKEWANLIFNERTYISTDNETTNKWIESWSDYIRLYVTCQDAVELSFWKGTAALVNVISGVNADDTFSPQAKVEVQLYGADDIFPISWNNKVCTEAAFRSITYINAKKLTQFLVYKNTPNGYVIEAAYFDKNGSQVDVEDYLTYYETGSHTPPFALFKPAISNTYDPYSCLGVSVFDDALGAIQLADEAFDNMNQDIELGRKMLALSETMLRREVTYDNDTGAKLSDNLIVPMETNQCLFLLGDNSEEYFKEYNPDLRVDDNRRAIQTALQMLGTVVGFGNEYFNLEGSSGIRTATEVVAEHSALFRSVRKHENSIAPALETLVRSAIEMHTYATHNVVPQPETILVNFDDSVIEDSEAMDKRDRERVAAGLMQPFEYRMKWYGEDEETAKALSTPTLARYDIPEEL